MCVCVCFLLCRYDFDPTKTEIDILVDYGVFDTELPLGGMELNLEIGKKKLPSLFIFQLPLVSLPKRILIIIIMMGLCFERRH